MEQAHPQRISKKLLFVRSALCTFAFCIFMMLSCGRLNVFNFKSDATAGAPALEPTAGAPISETTVIPPVPVTGSFLTTVLMDEFSEPIAQAGVLADAGQFTTRTNDKGVFSLPVRLVKDNAVELDVEINGQTLLLNVQLPVADAVRSVDPTAGAELPRALGVSVGGYLPPPPATPSTRFPVVTLSLPPQAAQNAAANTPLLFLESPRTRTQTRFLATSPLREPVIPVS